MSDDRRLDGIDVARALAIIGMVTVHIGPLPPEAGGLAAFVYGSFHGKASVLFVLVAGIGVALMDRGRPTGEVRGRLVYRTIWLLPLGLWLQGMDHHIAVILQYYALYFLLLAPFVALRDRTLLVLAAVLLPIGSVLVLLAGGPATTQPGVTVADGPVGGLVGDLMLTGYYPVATWLAPMIAGLWLGRRELRDPRLQRWLVAGGLALLVGATWVGRGLEALAGRGAGEVGAGPGGAPDWWRLVSTAPHANMPLAVLGALGLAVAVVGVAVPVADRWPRLLWPLAAAGRLALTIYVGHILVFAATGDLLLADDLADGLRLVAAFTAISAAASVAWLRVAARGPLEAAARWPWEHTVRPAIVRLHARLR